MLDGALYVLQTDTTMPNKNNNSRMLFLMRMFVDPHAANGYFLSLNCPPNSLRILLLFRPILFKHMPDENHVNLVTTSIWLTLIYNNA